MGGHNKQAKERSSVWGGRGHCTARGCWGEHRLGLGEAGPPISTSQQMSQPHLHNQTLRKHMCTQTHTCTHTYTHTDTHGHTDTHVHTRTYTCIHMHTDTCTHIHIHVHTCTETHAHTHTCTHADMCATYMYTHEHTCTHMYTHTCRCTRFSTVDVNAGISSCESQLPRQQDTGPSPAVG